MPHPKKFVLFSKSDSSNRQIGVFPQHYVCERGASGRPPRRRSSIVRRRTRRLSVTHVVVGNMTTAELVFLIIPIIVQAVNNGSATFQLTDTVFKHADIMERHLGAAVQVNLKFVNGQFFPRRLDSLKQWKKRRKCYNFVNAPNKLIVKRSARRMMDYKTLELSDHSSLVKSFKRRWPVVIWRKWLFTDDYLLLINQHWLQFNPPDPSSQYALGALYVVMMTLGCTGNAIVLLMYFK